MKRNLLNSVKLVKPPTSVFDFTHDVKLSCNMGELVPTFIEDVTPGDRWRLNCEALIKLAAMAAPMMHRCDVFMHYFFVPYRLLWPNSENFFMGKKVGGLDVAPPFFDAYDWRGNRLSDFLGLPNDVADGLKASALFHAAYQCVYNDYYKPTGLDVNVDFQLVDGDNSLNNELFEMRYRGWEHDYFTACLKEPQEGDTVVLPLGEMQDVHVYQNVDPVANPPGYNTVDGSQTSGPTTIQFPYEESDDIGVTLPYAKTSDLVVSPIDIRELRRSMKLQEFLERQNVGGDRYGEFVYAMTGVYPQDSRLQRSEYITGSKSAIQVSEVLQTSESNETPQGNMAGHGMAVVDGYGGGYAVKEHGCIIGIMSVLPRTAYFQGIPRKFLKLTDRYQYFFNQFEHIGEQEVRVAELYADTNTYNQIFGYNPRYTEYKVPFNRVAGQFRTTLKHWHMAREFSGAPNLNPAFITSDPTMRIFAVTDPGVDHLYCHILHKAFARRQMSKYSTPHI